MRDGIFRALPVVLALVTAACSDDPTEQNSLLAPLPFVEVAVRETTITATSGSTFRQYVPMNGGINLVGRSGNYTASTIIGFYGNLFPWRDTVSVVSAQLTMRAASFFGDSAGTFGFTVHRIERNWGQTTVTWDSIQAGFYDPSVLRGEFNGRVGSDTELVHVDLDTTMARLWLRSTAEGEIITTKYGFVLIPTPGTNVVRGFHSFEADSGKNIPTLTIISVNQAGTVRDTMTFNLGIDTFAGSIDGLDGRTDLLSVQAGVVYRSTLNFDVGFVPVGSIVHKAELTLERDPATSKLNRFSGDSSVAAHMMISSDRTTGFELTSTVSTRKPGAADTYLLDARRAVQAWVGGPNYGLLLRISGAREFQAFDLVTFQSPTSPAVALRPRLRILYSVPKN